jgi:membrane fusion protein, multidrug efflux system
MIYIQFVLPVLGMVYVTTVAAPSPVIVTEVRQERFADRVEALGTLRARESMVLTASVTDTVSAIHFDDGDRVTAGKILVEMTSDEERALRKEARAAAEEARRQYERIKAVEAKGTATQSLLDERRRQWQTAQARLIAVESRLIDRLIRAPFTGIVGLRNISVGTLVTPGDAVTTLDDDSEMKLDFPVPSTYLDTLRPGLAVEATTRVYSDRLFLGEVKSIDSRVDPVTRAVVVRAMLPNPERILKPGILMYVELLRNPREALVIPEKALLPLADKQYVLVVNEKDGNKAERREIRVGARRPGEVEVLQGLNLSEKVIIDGAIKVRPGQSVTIRAVDDGRRPLKEVLQSAPTAQKKQ